MELLWHIRRTSVSLHASCMDLELEEGLTWYIACIYLVFFLFLEHHLGGCTSGDIPLSILGVDHSFSLWSSPSSWHFTHSSFELVALGSTHVGWLHASCGPLAILGWLLWSILLGGLLYCFLTHASWRAHLVSSSRWPLEHILLCWRYFTIFCMHASWRVNSMWTFSILS
jgi:hypothetical protein